MPRYRPASWRRRSVGRTVRPPERTDVYVMPTVALVFGSFRGGGVARVMLRLAAALLERDIAVHLVVGRHQGELLEEIPVGATVIELATANPLSTFARLLRAEPSLAAAMLRPTRDGSRQSGKLRHLPSLIGYLERHRPEAVVAATAPFNLIALWARQLSRVPARVVISEHNVLTRPDQGVEHWRYGLPPALLQRHYPKADAVVAVSEGVAQELRTLVGLPDGGVVVIYNPVVDAGLEAQAALPVAHPWLEDGGPPVILGVGKVYAPGKDFATLIRAFARLRRQRPCRLVILGDKAASAKNARQLDEVLSLPAALGIAEDVDFPGFVANPFAWMRRARVFVLSSAWEGLSLVLAEAMATGCAVVSTDCPHGPSELLAGGRFGPLVPVGDDAQLALAIASLLDHPTDPAILKARARDFSVERSIERYLQLLLPDPQAGSTPPRAADS